MPAHLTDEKRKAKGKKSEMTDFVLPPVFHFEDKTVFCTKIRGFSHYRDNKPCQDAFITSEINDGGKKMLILAVADGHGSAKHDMSEMGSEIAVKSAEFVLQSMQKKYGFDAHKLYMGIKSDFPGEVIREWRERVIADMKKRKIDYSEANLKNSLVRYGTTLMFSLIIGDCVIIGKLGDGNIVIFDYKSGASEPILPEKTLVGGSTYSMCHQTKAVSKFEVKFHQGFNMISISTDGLCDSFENDDDFHNAILSVSDYLKENGEEKTGEMLPSFLNYCSTNGSGDDITLVLAVKIKADTAKGGVK